MALQDAASKRSDNMCKCLHIHINTSQQAGACKSTIEQFLAKSQV